MLSERARTAIRCPLSGVKRTLVEHAPMSVSDPKRTLRATVWDRPHNLKLFALKVLGRLHLVPHVNAPVADFPVRKTIGAHHFLVDLTLPYGQVLNDYNKRAQIISSAA